VPTEEETGIAILAALLEQFPVIDTEDEEVDSDLPYDVVMTSGNRTQPVELETWIIAPAEIRISDAIVTEGAMPEGDTGSTSNVSETTYRNSIDHQGIAPAMLQMMPPDYRTPAIQIGFNFAESESV